MWRKTTWLVSKTKQNVNWWRVSWLLSVILLSSPVYSEAGSGSESAETVEEHIEQRSPTDPWENFNRKVYGFNEAFDRTILRPVTLGYVKVTPNLVQSGVSNFFSNLDDFIVVGNDLLQGKFVQFGSDLARVTLNTTLGLAGLIDVASTLGLPKHEEDFGQTLGRWGVESGPYLVVPFFGPRTVRDTAGLVVDSQSDPTVLLDDDVALAGLTALEVIDLRASLLVTDGLIKGDKYVFIREAYLQRREFLVNDGVVEDDPFLDEEDW